MIPYGRQSISDDDVRAVVDVLHSDFLTQGPVVPAFEQAVADHVGAPHAVAVNSATSALHIACLGLGLGPGDRLWTVPNTFIASANCGAYCGASVDFVDIDPATWTMSVPTLAERLAAAEREGHLPKVVVPVAFGGQSCDMRGVRRLAERYGFAVIEDASHAVGGRYAGQPVGGHPLADITVFSFHPVKIITTGEGGLALTQDDALADRLRLLRSHGVTRDTARLERADAPGWYYEQQALGFNCRMTDLQAALGSAQLERLDAMAAARRRLAARYDAAFAGTAVEPLRRRADRESALHLYAVRLPTGRRDAAFAALRAADIGVNVHYYPIHLQPYYRALGFAAGQFPQAEAYASRTLSLPLYPDLSEVQQDEVVERLLGALAA
jgi:UDP-4-amino-4,6-dideoxy-N-acetyl-beta-L-altrosamine transaminase